MHLFTTILLTEDFLKVLIIVAGVVAVACVMLFFRWLERIHEVSILKEYKFESEKFFENKNFSEQQKTLEKMFLLARKIKHVPTLEYISSNATEQKLIDSAIEAYSAINEKQPLPEPTFYSFRENKAINDFTKEFSRRI